MNFGLALAKPGESKLGLAARLWDANFAAWHLDSIQLDLRIDSEIDRNHAKDFKQLDGSPKGLAAVREFERLRFPDRTWGAAPSSLTMVKRTKQCEKCAREHYHSWYFNTPWLDKCPIHDTQLLTKCPTCKNDWPDADSIHKRACHTCGIRSKSDDRLSLECFTTKEFDAIRKLDLFFSKPLVLALPRWNHLFNQPSERNDEFSMTRLYPSVLAAHRYGKAPEWCESLTIYKQFKTCRHIPFTLIPTTDGHDEVTDSHFSKMTATRKNVLKRVLNSLQFLTDHKFGECTRNLTDYRFRCFVCESADQIQHAVFRQLELQLPWVVCHPRGYDSERCFDPGLVQSIHDTKADQDYLIPDEIMWKIYELDVLSLLKRLVLHIQSTSQPNIKQLSMKHGSLTNVLFRPFSPYSNAYFFVLDGHQCHLYYPDEYEDDTLKDFNNWLSITDTF